MCAILAAGFAASSISAIPDDDLVAGALKGNGRCYPELYRRYATQVYRYALSLTRNQTEAEDLLQEVFIKAFSKLQQYRGPGVFKRWLFRICRNLALTRKSKRKVEEAPIENQAEITLGACEPQKEWLRGLEIQESSQNLLSALTPDLQEIMLLRVVEDLSYKEISDLTGISEVNLRQMISRGLARLRKEWSAHDVL